MNSKLKLLLGVISISVMAGCATPDWATNNEWKKKTGWEFERNSTMNPFLP